MAKRILDCYSSDFENFSKYDLLDAIAKSEGRTIACETIGTIRPMLGDITNAEFVSALGADILLLNMFDVNQPEIQGLPAGNPDDTIRLVKRLTGRPVGINLEPVAPGEEAETDPLWKMSQGRRATLENARRACQMGVDMILLTGNPGMGVSKEAIENTLKQYKEHLGDKIILAAGKMHAAGVLSEAAEHIITKDDVKRFRKAGADILLFPAPATVPGITTEYIKELVSYAHSLGALTITAIGTSQEGSDIQTIRQIALMCKMTGTDIHHLGDTGYTGMALPENIQAYSIAVRGVRHTYFFYGLTISVQTGLSAYPPEQAWDNFRQSRRCNRRIPVRARTVSIRVNNLKNRRRFALPSPPYHTYRQSGVHGNQYPFRNNRDTKKAVRISAYESDWLRLP